MPRAEIDKILMEYSYARFHFWKEFITRPHAEKLISTDLFIFAISESPRLTKDIRETIEVNNHIAITHKLEI
jgi:hypothetical protein